MIWKVLRGMLGSVDLADFYLALLVVLAFMGELGGVVGALIAAFYTRLCFIQQAIERLHREDQ